MGLWESKTDNCQGRQHNKKAMLRQYAIYFLFSGFYCFASSISTIMLRKGLAWGSLVLFAYSEYKQYKQTKKRIILNCCTQCFYVTAHLPHSSSITVSLLSAAFSGDPQYEWEATWRQRSDRLRLLQTDTSPLMMTPTNNRHDALEKWT